MQELSRRSHTVCWSFWNDKKYGIS